MTSTSSTTARARRSEHRRDELLDAAEELIREQGVNATTVSDITERAGVAKGTFYLYFDSKDHVVAGLYERLAAGMTEIVQDALARVEGNDFYALADDLTASIIDYWIEQRELFRAIKEAGETPETAELKEECNRQVIEMFHAGLLLGIERGVVAVKDPLRAAQFIYFGCEGATTSALLAPDAIDRDELVEAAQETIRKILRP